MGSGSYSTHTYHTRAASRPAGASAFAYTDAIRSGRATAEVHDLLDPKRTNTAGDLIRESRDSDEHPNSLPIAVIFDVTGSMGRIPVALQQELPKLFALLLNKGYVEDPQILWGAVGDAFSDRVPLQIGEFESDNRIDETMEAIYLEGNGGGGNHESYELAAYFMARHTALDSVEKRGAKGYCFFIGDERIYNKVRREQVEKVIGDTLQEDIDTTDIFAELEEKFHTFFLFANHASGYKPEHTLPEDVADGVSMGWRPLLGERCIELDDPTAVCETIAMLIGLNEGVIDLDDGLGHLAEVGTDVATIGTVGDALATFNEARGAGVTKVVVGDPLPDLADAGSGSGGVERL